MTRKFRSKTTKVKKTEKPSEKKRRITKKGSNKEIPTKIDILKGDLRLHINRGRTVNLGDYNSAKMDVGISRDLGTGEKLNSTFNAMDEVLTTYLDKWAKAQDILDN